MMQFWDLWQDCEGLLSIPAMPAASHGFVSCSISGQNDAGMRSLVPYRNSPIFPFLHPTCSRFVTLSTRKTYQQSVSAICR